MTDNSRSHALRGNARLDARRRERTEAERRERTQDAERRGFRSRAERGNEWALCLLLLALVGCGQKDSSLAEVRGDVTFCGQPAVAEISFELLNTAGKAVGRASTATSDEAGRFRLMLDESQPGAKIGRNRVAIRVQRLAPSREAAEKSDPSRDGVIGTLKATQVIREVQAGDNEFHFRLTY